MDPEGLQKHAAHREDHRGDPKESATISEIAGSGHGVNGDSDDDGEGQQGSLEYDHGIHTKAGDGCEPAICESEEEKEQVVVRNFFVESTAGNCANADNVECYH